MVTEYKGYSRFHDDAYQQKNELTVKKWQGVVQLIIISVRDEKRVMHTTKSSNKSWPLLKLYKDILTWAWALMKAARKHKRSKVGTENLTIATRFLLNKRRKGK